MGCSFRMHAYNVRARFRSFKRKTRAKPIYIGLHRTKNAEFLCERITQHQLIRENTKRDLRTGKGGYWGGNGKSQGHVRSGFFYTHVGEKEGTQS